MKLTIPSILILLILIGCAQQEIAEVPVQGEAVKEAAIEEPVETEVSIVCNATGLLQEEEVRYFSIEGEDYNIKANAVTAENAELSVNDVATDLLSIGQTHTFEDKSEITVKDIVESSEGRLFVEFCFIAAPYEPVTCIIGDANFDGVLDMDDKVLIQRMTKGSRVQKIPKQVCCVDANKDGAVSMQDVTYLLKYIYGELEQETCTS